MSIFPGLYDYFTNPAVNDVFIFNYPCSSQSKCSAIKLRFPPGKFKIECWGAQGGTSFNVEGGKGGYSSGEIELTSYVNAYLYIGAHGDQCTGFEQNGMCTSLKSFNGGGYGISLKDDNGTRYATSGGGATDIRFKRDAYENRIIVAGGGGGSGYGTDFYNSSLPGGYGGGLEGGNGVRSTVKEGYLEGTGGTQTEPGHSFGKEYMGNGSFGVGGNGVNDGCGGGSGWYGGGGGKQAGSSGGGGSSFVLTEDADNLPPSYAFQDKQFFFTNTQLMNGTETIPSPISLKETEIGHSGNGAIRITLLKLYPSQHVFCYMYTQQQCRLIFSHLFQITLIFSQY